MDECKPLLDGAHIPEAELASAKTILYGDAGVDSTQYPEVRPRTECSSVPSSSAQHSVLSISVLRQFAHTSCVPAHLHLVIVHPAFCPPPEAWYHSCETVNA